MKQLIADEYLLSDGSIDVAALREDLFDYFNTLHYMLTDTEFNMIAEQARGWIEEHLRDGNVFEHSVRSKAYEMSSGDHHADFYKALLLRRDQLLAARDVFREYTSRLREIFSDDRDAVLASLRRFDFDQGIYLRATEYAQAREQALEDYSVLLDNEIADVDEFIHQEEDALNLDSADKIEQSRRTSTKDTSTDPKKTKSKRLFHRSI